MRIDCECYQSIDKEVKVHKTSGAVYLPKEWIGKRVRVLLLDPLDEETKPTE